MWSNAVLANDNFDEQSQIEVRDNDGFKGIFATEPIAQDSVVFYLNGTIATQPTRYTIQLGPRKHLTFPSIRKTDDDLDYCWQYLNHSCEPNGYMNTGECTFRALRDIAPGEEITFNYLTTESEMAVPFSCICGSESCFGFIQGRNFLSAGESARLSRAVGEDNVVTMFMPAFRRPSGSLENSMPGQRR
ncbi:MAG TPA: SET domain-containing protein [Pyrinomonadaceae bacterium]|nr:SET domain-containing protein [Pyrinomonadaceae bacterium]